MLKNGVWLLFWMVAPIVQTATTVVIFMIASPLWVKTIVTLGTATLLHLALRETRLHMRQLVSKFRQRTA